MPLDHLPMHVDRLKQEIKSLEEKTKDARIKVRKFVQASYVTMDEVDDYKRNKDKLRNYESLRKQADELQQQLNYYTSPGKFVLDISEEKLKDLSTFLHKSLTRSDLVEMLHYLCTNPTSNIDIFNALAARRFGMSSYTHIKNHQTQPNTKKDSDHNG
jgi:type I site-specific restriction endonuclease